jgi:hypothetical protein
MTTKPTRKLQCLKEVACFILAAWALCAVFALCLAPIWLAIWAINK